MQPEAGLPLQRGCPRCGAPVPPENLELHLLRCQPAGVVGSVFGAASGEQWPCSTCTFLNAEEQRCCAMCGGVRDDAEAQSPARGAAVLGSVFTVATDGAEAAAAGGVQAEAEGEAEQETAQDPHGAILAAMRIQDEEHEAALSEALDEAAAAVEAEEEEEEHPSGLGSRVRLQAIHLQRQQLREAAALRLSHDEARAAGAAHRMQQAR